ncbi:hypothetical protein D4764_21G0008520 [Takifugu flavidus]|uniref:Uncharacterized protein n=1 Tax=Takifugu flavidus TaxID=433684 RepID=A0A5C6NEM7_9TELE|nr:hypothetical protein D4764_21G0008520 [Takifugu flavidus]
MKQNSKRRTGETSSEDVSMEELEAKTSPSVLILHGDEDNRKWFRSTAPVREEELPSSTEKHRVARLSRLSSSPSVSVFHVVCFLSVLVSSDARMHTLPVVEGAKEKKRRQQQKEPLKDERRSGRQEHEVQLSAGSSAAAGIPSAAPSAPSLQQLQLQLTSR